MSAPRISPETLAFLRELKANNTKEWFEANKKRFETIKAENLAFAQYLKEKVGEWDEAVAGMDIKKAIFRQHRDVRFSKDKSPYKTNIGVFLGQKSPLATGGYYLHIEPGASFVGGGYHQPMPQVLKAVRQEIDYNFRDFKAIVEDPKFKSTFGGLDGGRLKRAPKDYPADHPAIEYLMYTDYTAAVYLKDEEVTAPGFADRCVEAFSAIKPLLGFLNHAVAGVEAAQAR